MTQTIWIARHGNRLDFVHPDWFNTAERRYDPPLSEDGLIQADQLAQRLKSEKITHIFSSPFLRAIQTAYPVAEMLNLSIKIELGLSEWLNPDWMSENPQIHPQEYLASIYPCLDWTYTSKIRPKYPENEEMVKLRTRTIARKLVEEFSDNILLVGHSISVLGATEALLGKVLNPRVSLCCLFQLVRHDQIWKLALNNDTSHLF